MQLVYRGIPYPKNTGIASSEKVTLTYRGVAFDRVRSFSDRSKSIGLTYRGQKYYPTPSALN